MTTTLIKHGDSLALVIDQAILERLQISADTQLELSTSGDLIMITPVRSPTRDEKLGKSLEKVNERFGDDLRRLGE